MLLLMLCSMQCSRQHAAGSTQQAARSRQWDAAVLLIRQLGGRDRHAAKALLAGMFEAGNPAAALAVQHSLLASLLDSETEQQRAALKQEAQEVSRQRAGLQQLLIGVAGTHSRIEAARACCSASGAAAAAAAAAWNVEQCGATYADSSERAAAAAAAAHVTPLQVTGAQPARASRKLLTVSRRVSMLLKLPGAVVVTRRLVGR
jgi:hypothetical protein